MANVNLSALIRELHPKITKEDFKKGSIVLVDFSDGKGAFIESWNFEEKPHLDLEKYFL